MTTSLIVQGTNSTLIVVENNQTLVSSGTTTVIDSGSGAIGPAGNSGSASARYSHTQASASAVWTIPHNLGFRPVVAIFTVGGVEILAGEVIHLTLNTLTITFDVAFAGSAALV